MDISTPNQSWIYDLKQGVFMMIRHLSVFLMSLMVATMTTNSAAQTPTYRSSAQILEQAPSDAWYRLKQENLLYITLDNGKQVIIELAPMFAPAHVGQIKLLANHGYWDGLSIYRVQDNYVVQFGSFDITQDKDTKELPKSATKLPAEFFIDASSLNITKLPDQEPYADAIGFVDGFPVAVKDGKAFLVHCYGMVGSARSNPPDSSAATNLYVMIGQPARHLDQQISVVGRVVQGIEHLSSLPRGSGVSGFYTKDEQPTPIKSVRMGSSLPANQQVQFEAVRSDSQTFLDLVQARRHLQGEWFATPMSGGLGICDIRQTVRVVK